MPAYNIYEAKTNLSALVEKAVSGEEVVIAKAGKPILRLVPLEKTGGESCLRPAPGFAKGQLDALIEEMDKPWPEDMQRAFGMID